MEKTFNPAAYVSPNVEVLNLEVECAILQDSLTGVGHDGFNRGDEIPF